MTSDSNFLHDDTRSRDVAFDRRATLSTPSTSSKRFSAASIESGESSVAANQRTSLVASGLNDASPGAAADKTAGSDAHKPIKDGRGSHRSHRSRDSGGFLLPTSAFDPPTDMITSASATENMLRQRKAIHDPKGKSAPRSPEKNHMKRRSNAGMTVGSSPLVGNVTVAGTGNGTAGNHGMGGDSTTDHVNDAVSAQGVNGVSIGLDVDSAQIVNLALNLSESRRNASRRMVSNPFPPVTTGLGDSFTGGSLRQHLQQQRRSSRNISPKPDKAERTATASPKVVSGQRINSPLHAAFDHHEGQYQYQFSASTLARAEKAKNTIELMAQYRRLLQYVPPLKPQPTELSSTSSPTATDTTSPTPSVLRHSRSVSTTAAPARQLGRPYNPLQYIRNRKVRARNSRAIDGEAQAFGDLSKVSSWVDAVSNKVSSGDYHNADISMMPYSKAAEEAASQQAPPSMTIGKNQATPVKVKRPRLDWITNPADMLADVFWLEQDDNRRLIEDRYGRKIFPQGTELKMSISRSSEEPDFRNLAVPLTKKEPNLHLLIDTKLPEFKSLKSDSERLSDSATSRAKQRLRDIRDNSWIHHGHNGSNHEHGHYRSRSRSESSSSDSDLARRPLRRYLSGKAGFEDHGKDILEKQMMELLAKEAREAEQKSENSNLDESNETQLPALRYGHEKARNSSGSHSRSVSLVNSGDRMRRDPVRNEGSSSRASLEVPVVNPRRSLEGLDSTAPNSPQSKAGKIMNSFIPSVAIDLSPPRSRNNSPTRRTLSRVRSRIRPLYDRSTEPSDERVEEGRAVIPLFNSKEPTPESPETPERRKRSLSPTKTNSARKTEANLKPVHKAGNLQRRKGEESSGIRGIFRKANPVSRVSDFLWKKESPPGAGTASGFSTDDSDGDDIRGNKIGNKDSRNSSAGDHFENADALPVKEKIVLPIFTLPFEKRGRQARSDSDDLTTPGPMTEQQRAREQRRKFSRVQLLETTPRIDVQTASPTSSPETGPSNLFQGDSSISDIESRRGSFSNGVQSADARLNAILELPGKRRNALPVTGLSSLGTTHDARASMEGNRKWSISDRSVSTTRGPMTKREIARIRALLLSSGIKAKEISRRAAEPKNLKTDQESPYTDIAVLAKDNITPVPKSQEHRLAARILSDDVQLSSQMWHSSADIFVNSSIPILLERIFTLQSRLVDNLTPMTRNAADEADEVSKDLMTSQTLKVKRLMDKMDKMMRRRRRRFRWLRRGGWVLVEWMLVGVMWFVWLLVVLTRIVFGVGSGIVGSLKWLFWLD